MREHLIRFWVRYVNRHGNTQRIDDLLEKDYLTQEEYDAIVDRSELDPA